ncbi:unnamed protein product, partial [marine sediment metagenome]
CVELGITRQTLYRHVTPKGAIRPDGEKLLARTAPFLDGPIPFGLGLRFPDSLVAGLAPLAPGAVAPRLAEAASPGTTAAASAWNGHLAVRALGDAVGPLRGLVARFLAGYRALPMSPTCTPTHGCPDGPT